MITFLDKFTDGSRGALPEQWRWFPPGALSPLRTSFCLIIYLIPSSKYKDRQENIIKQNEVRNGDNAPSGNHLHCSGNAPREPSVNLSRKVIICPFR
jgi:hypothetical protein